MSKKSKSKWDEEKAWKSAARRAHFANGGTLAMWRGRSSTFSDRKKERSRRACRDQVKY